MSREVEERIVSMRFDNKDFEENARTTVNTLGKLKESLDFKETSEGITAFEKARKALKMDNLTKGIKNLKGGLSGIKGTLENALTVSDAPIHAVESLFGKIRSMTANLIGFDLANKIAGSIESAMKQLTIQPISAGWGEYELKMDSIKTIMSGSGESLEKVKETLEELNLYADKTIYSFSDMTSNIGKFTNNRVPLEQATSAMKGIANAAADAGQGAQQASSAMYNISQAIGVGHMLTIDWKSIENANMATVKLKETFMQAAAASGQLEKVVTEENGEKVVKYYRKVETLGDKYKNKTFKQLKETEKERLEVTAENFRETLSDKWLDKDSMLKAFAIYSGDVKDIDTYLSWGFTEEEAAKLMEIGEEAMKAATEVRTFSKMWDALKESAQSGWAQSMELIFGDMQEATVLWTKLNSVFDEMLSQSAENRNTILQNWRGLSKDQNGILKQVSGMRDGRQDLIDSMFRIIETFQLLGKTINKAFENVFGKFNGRQLADITQKFYLLTSHIKRWFTSTKDGESRLSKLQKGFEGIAAIVKVVARGVKAAFELVSKFVEPVANFVVNGFSKIFGFFADMGDMAPDEVLNKITFGVGKAWKKLTNLFKPSKLPNGDDGKAPIAVWFENTWKSVKKTVKEWAAETGMTNIVTSIWGFLSDAYAEAEKIWNNIVKWDGWKAIGKFFSDTWGWIEETFIGSTHKPKKDFSFVTGYTKLLDNADSGVKPKSKPTVVTVFEGLKKDIEKAWNDIYEWEGWEAVGNFFSDVWGWLMKTFVGSNDEKTGEYKEPEIADVLTSVKNGIVDAWDAVMGWEGWPLIGQFFADCWEWIASQFQPRKGEDGQLTQSPIEEALSNVWNGVVSVWNTVSNWTGWKDIGKFFSDAWGWITGKNRDNHKTALTKEINLSKNQSPTGMLEHYVKESTDKTIPKKPEDAPAVKFLQDIGTELTKAWDTIAGWTGWQDIGKFFNDTWTWITGLFETKEEPPAKVLEKNGTLDQKVTIIETVGNFFTKVGEALNDMWTNVSEFVGLGNQNDTMTKLFEAIGGLVNSVLGVLTNIITAVTHVLTGKTTLEDVGTIFLTLLTVTLPKIITMTSDILKLKVEQPESVGSKVMMLGGGLLMIAGAIYLLGNMEKGKLLQGVAAVAILGIAMNGLMNTMTDLNNSKANKLASATDEPVTTGERIVRDLIKWVGIIGMVSATMKLLPPIIEEMGKSKVSGGEVMELLIGVTTLISGVSIAMAAVSAITGGKGLDIMGTINTVASVLAAIGMVLLAFGATGWLLQGIGEENVVSVLKTAEVVMEAFGRVINGFVRGIFGVKSEEEKTQDAIDSMNMLAKATEGLDDETINKITKFVGLISMLNEVTKPQAGFVTHGGWTISALGEMGQYMSEFINTLKAIEVTDEELAKVRKLTNLLSQVMELGNGEYFDNDIFQSNMRSLSEAFADTSNLDRLSVLQTLFDSVQSGLTDDSTGLSFDATAIVDAITKAIGLGNTAIGLAVHTMVQNGINLLKSGDSQYSQFDTSALSGLSGMFGEGGIEGVMNGLIPDGAASDMAEKLGGYYGEVQKQLEEKMGGQKGFDFFNFDMFDPESENYDKNIEGMVGSMSGYLDQLQEGLKEAGNTEIVITPVIDMSDWDNQKAKFETAMGLLPTNLTMGGISMPDVNFNQTDVQASMHLRSISAKLDAINNQIAAQGTRMVSATSGVRGSVEGVRSSLNNMKVVLDTGVLVGQLTPLIDKKLFQRAALAAR